MPANTNLDWRSVSISAATIIVSMLGWWVMQGKDLVTRQEVKVMISTEGPYVKDQVFIMSKLSDNSKINEEVAKTLGSIKVELERLRITLDLMAKKTQQ